MASGFPCLRQRLSLPATTTCRSATSAGAAAACPCTGTRQRAQARWKLWFLLILILLAANLSGLSRCLWHCPQDSLSNCGNGPSGQRRFRCRTLYLFFHLGDQVLHFMILLREPLNRHLSFVEPHLSLLFLCTHFQQFFA